MTKIRALPQGVCGIALAVPLRYNEASFNIFLSLPIGIYSSFVRHQSRFQEGFPYMENDISRKNWILIWVLGMAGQICWNVENSWFSTFVYNKVAPDPAIISWMVGVSAVVTTFCTFLVGTWSDRIGRRKPFVSIGYIFWGVFTIIFGLGEFLPKSPLMLVATFVVLADAS
jgi:MFS-type transporter involved in bile tolerance (Atg22 family)